MIQFLFRRMCGVGDTFDLTCLKTSSISWRIVPSKLTSRTSPWNCAVLKIPQSLLPNKGALCSLCRHRFGFWNEITIKVFLRLVRRILINSPEPMRSPIGEMPNSGISLHSESSPHPRSLPRRVIRLRMFGKRNAANKHFRTHRARC